MKRMQTTYTTLNLSQEEVEGMIKKFLKDEGKLPEGVLFEVRYNLEEESMTKSMTITFQREVQLHD